ncbi:hypothetical protein GCM10010329_18440 [Streptomyces spiroverticillatus]|uniref:ABC transporter permease n=1 Tax=Streptomyces finlayi TaxID=67296 RepID=A0A918WTY2_9ACTN|nr:hypothetical protein [Streptomyces finlayi]GGZ97453.1 hypothetical protein GCM10010329_18440 [Streptomyces spiroverticillatus]GHC82583.1 hypothetical protein GCM10010334_10920 [Streptomyces finlayi]
MSGTTSTLSPERTTAPAGPAKAPGALGGAIRAAVRQHKWALRITLALLVLVVGVWAGLRVWLEASGVSPDANNYGVRSAKMLAKYAADVFSVLPLLVGAFVAGPLIGRELESGTYKMAWTQSMSPARWLTIRLALPLTLVVVGVLLLNVSYRLLRGPFIDDPLAGWYQGGIYQGLGPASLAYCVLAVALGALVGLLVRRSVVSMAVTALAMGLLATLMSNVRGGLWPMRTDVGPEAAIVTAHAQETRWGHGAGWQDAQGVRIDPGACENAASEASMKRPDAYESVFEKCMADRGATTQYGDYHSTADFLPIQLVESAVLLGLAALAVVASYGLLRTRHGGRA